jgi:bacterioferritin-associated ferredoxin
MYVCLCYGISDKDLRELLKKNPEIATVKDLKSHCQAGRSCGSCLRAVGDFIEKRQLSLNGSFSGSDEVPIELGETCYGNNSDRG